MLCFYLLNRSQNSDEITVHVSFFGTVFKNLRFHLSTLQTQRFKEVRFQNVPVLEPSLKASIFIHFLGRVIGIPLCILK